jgi:hypothetical protein
MNGGGSGSAERGSAGRGACRMENDLKPVVAGMPVVCALSAPYPLPDPLAALVAALSAAALPPHLDLSYRYARNAAHMQYVSTVFIS